MTHNNERDELARITERLNAASKGPWQAGVAATSDGSEVCTTYEQKKAFLALSLNEGDLPLWIVDNGEVIPAATGDGPNAGHNAEFIAHAPTDIAYLLDLLKPRQVTTVEELDALPKGVVVREDRHGLIWELQGDGEGGSFWVETGDEEEYKSSAIELPVTVLHVGSL